MPLKKFQKVGHFFTFEIQKVGQSLQKWDSWQVCDTCMVALSPLFIKVNYLNTSDQAIDLNGKR